MSVIQFTALTPDKMSAALASALDAVSAIGDCGLLVAPPEPTAAMITAACEAAPITATQARQIWAAMVAAW